VPALDAAVRQVARRPGDALGGTELFLARKPLAVRVGPARLDLAPYNVHHVLLVARSRGRTVRLEHCPAGDLPWLDTSSRCRVTKLPACPVDLDELLAFEASLPREYVLGMRDCRHHVIDLLTWAYGLPVDADA
jgi:hypothetical protein